MILHRQEAGEQKQEVVVVTNMFDELQRLECAALFDRLFGNKVPGVRQRTHTHTLQTTVCCVCMTCQSFDALLAVTAAQCL